MDFLACLTAFWCCNVSAARSESSAVFDCPERLALHIRLAKTVSAESACGGGGSFGKNCWVAFDNNASHSGGDMPRRTWSLTHFCMSVTTGRPCLTACCNASESCLRGLALGPGRCQCRIGFILAYSGRCPPDFQLPRGKLARGAACLAEPPELLTLVSRKSIWVRESPCTNV